jgi:hypothetical protein
MRNSVFAILIASAMLISPPANAQSKADEKLMRETLALVKEVKEFGKTLGIEPTGALSEGSDEKPDKSMLWLWLQRKGTIALRTPIDIRVGLKFAAAQEQIPLQTLHQAGDYSLYFRQGNQFGDLDAVVTPDFARQSLFTKVMTIFHEDLHDDRNFDLKWEIEEPLVTPLSLLGALRYFRHKADHERAREAQSALEERARIAREILAVAEEGERLFGALPLPEARRALLKSIHSSGLYGRWFEHQLEKQEADTALEAKLSHDVAYYKYFARIMSLHGKAGDLKRLIDELKRIPRGADAAGAEKYISDLEIKYKSAGSNPS